MAEKEIFQYGRRETDYLSRRDKRLGAVIDRIGHVEREVIGNLFAALVHSIVGQQISTKAHRTIWLKMTEAMGTVTPEAVDRMGTEALQRFGISFRKADYIRSAARKVLSGELNIDALRTLPDEEVRARLTALDGVGVWTAEMLMLFSMQRPDILSFGDLGVQRGMRMVYRHRTIDRARFERYRRRLSPCGSVAALYFWAVAAGAVEGLTDPAETKRQTARKAADATRTTPPDNRPRERQSSRIAATGFVRATETPTVAAKVAERSDSPIATKR